MSVAGKSADRLLINIDASAHRDLLQLVNNGIERERRRPKFGAGAAASARCISRLQQLAADIASAKE